MQKQVIIDCFPESAKNYRRGYAIVAVDVIRATTSAITIAARGGRCFPVPSIEVAIELQSRLGQSLCAGEIGGELAPGFHVNNSPAELAKRNLIGRPVILLSSSGTRLICEAMGCDAVYLACFRNYGHVARQLAEHHSQIALIGAGSRREFREEDQMCCSWIARDFAEMGYAPANQATFDFIRRWATEHPELVRSGKSADYLRRSGQVKDLDFILAHINDLRSAYVMRGDELATEPGTEDSPVPARKHFINSAPETILPC